MSHSTPSTLPKTASTQPPPLSVARLPPILPLLVTLKPLPSALSMGVPMDVDVTRKARMLLMQRCKPSSPRLPLLHERLSTHLRTVGGAD